MKSNKIEILRSIYLFLFSFIGIVMAVFGLISVTSSIVDLIYSTTDSLYKINSIATGSFSVAVGLFIFIFHWRIIKREGRLNGNMVAIQPDANFWGNLFFYLLSFTGLIIVASSFIRIGSNIFHINYSVPNNAHPPANEAEPIRPPSVFISPNISGIIKSVISFCIGIVVWIYPWRAIQRMRKEGLRDEGKETNKHD